MSGDVAVMKHKQLELCSPPKLPLPDQLQSPVSAILYSIV